MLLVRPMKRLIAVGALVLGVSSGCASPPANPYADRGDHVAGGVSRQ